MPSVSKRPTNTLKSNVTAQDPAKSLFVLENMLFAIRRDLGHKNKNLKQGDLLSLFVTDIDQHLH